MESGDGTPTIGTVDGVVGNQDGQTDKVVNTPAHGLQWDAGQHGYGLPIQSVLCQGYGANDIMLTTK
jgi:hypothetical protein